MRWHFSDTEHHKAGWLLVIFAVVYLCCALQLQQSREALLSSRPQTEDCSKVQLQTQADCYRLQTRDKVQVELEQRPVRAVWLYMFNLVFAIQVILLVTFRMSWLQVLLVFNIDTIALLYADMLELLFVLGLLSLFSLFRRYQNHLQL